jgi:hypothetical protein
MAVVTLPLTFQNSFWSQDYRTGLEVLFAQLEKVCAQPGSLFLVTSHPSYAFCRELWRMRRLSLLSRFAYFNFFSLYV